MGLLLDRMGGQQEQNFSPMRRFQEAEKRCLKVLRIGDELTEAVVDMCGNPNILMVGGTQLHPSDFTLLLQDYQAVGPVVYPGKSCMFDFLGLSDVVENKELDIILQRTYGGNTRGKNTVYVAQVPGLQEKGFRIFYTPVRGNGLHLRMVYSDHMSMTYPLLDKLSELPPEVLEGLIEEWKSLETLY